MRSLAHYGVIASRQSAFAAGGGGSVDPYYANVSLLSHMNGADGSTTFTDEKGHTINTFGNVQLDTAQIKFGSASGLFDGTGDYLTVASDTALQLYGGNFTIEFWMRAAATGSDMGLITKRVSTNARGLVIYWSSADRIEMRLGDTNTAAWEVSFSGSSALSANTWYHIALSRSGNDYYGFVDGVQLVGSPTTSAATLADDTESFFIGINQDGSLTPLNGWIDDLRITKGVARYTANFTPPSSQFPDS